MTPDVKFYENTENFSEWRANYAFSLFDTAAYGVKITTPEGELIVFAIPDKDILGFGKVVIPFNVPTRKNRRKYHHPYEEEAKINRAFIGETNQFSQIYDKFGLKPKSMAIISSSRERYKGHFRFTPHTTIEGEWYLIAERILPGKIDEDRLIRDGSWVPKSAVGLIQSLCNLYEGWEAHPLREKGPNYKDPNSLAPLTPQG